MEKLNINFILVALGYIMKEKYLKYLLFAFFYIFWIKVATNLILSFFKTKKQFIYNKDSVNKLNY